MIQIPINYDTETRINVICTNIFPSIHKDCIEPTDGKTPFTKAEAFEYLAEYRDKGYMLAEREAERDSYKERIDKCYDVYYELISSISDKEELLCGTQ